MATRMQQRRGSAADWAAQNPVLADGEIGFERDTKVLKVGDGETPYASLVMPYLTAGGGTMTGHLNLIAPTSASHAARKADVDTRVPLSGGTMTGALSVLAPTQSSHAARKADVDTRVPLSGGTMTGPLTLVAPTSASHAARKSDVDAKLSLSGGTINGNLRVTGTLISDSEPHIFVQSGTPSSPKVDDLWAW
jgi:hypothetical protein